MGGNTGGSEAGGLSRGGRARVGLAAGPVGGGVGGCRWKPRRGRSGSALGCQGGNGGVPVRDSGLAKRGKLLKSRFQIASGELGGMGK